MDRVKAFKLLESAACQGDSVAQKNLGLLYFDGADESPKDNQKSYAWFSVASYNGLKEANGLREMVAKYMSTKELRRAKILSREYINNYPAPIDGIDTNKSDTQCKWMDS